MASYESEEKLIQAQAQRERSTSNLLDHLSSLVNTIREAVSKEFIEKK